MSEQARKLELPSIEVAGTPTELGSAQGEALRDRIVPFVQQRLDALRGYLAERSESSRFEEFVRVGHSCLAAARRFYPNGIAESDACA